MTFRKPVREDFPESRLGDQAYAVYKDSDGCDDGEPKGWSPCFTGDGTPCNFYGKKDCYHKQGVK